jgi:short-subunit dehydrogenase
MKLGRLAIAGSVVGLGAYWVARFLQPEHSALVLNNSVVLITGASGGIGRAFALAFARQGARIVLAARRADVLDAVRQEIEPYAADMLVVPVDIADDGQIEALVEAALERFGQIDILLNNAGLGLDGQVHTHDVQAIRQLVDVNLASAMCLTRLCLPGMLARRTGWIVNVTSVGGRVHSPFQPVYGASRAGMLAFADGLRRQLEGTGIEVVSVLPAYTYSRMIRPSTERWAKRMGITFDTPDYIAARTIEGLLRGEQEIVFGGLTMRALIWLERHFPALMTLALRAVVTPEMIAAHDQ